MRGEGVYLGIVLVAALLAAPAMAAEDETVVAEVLEILKERGIVDEQEYERLSLKNAAYEEEQGDGFLSSIDWSGDLRLRLENFWYDRDPVANQDDRTRARYRFRLKGVVPVNEYVKAGFRVASGETGGEDGRISGDERSTNRTIGKDDDFGNDAIFLDQAYLTLQAPRSWLGETSKLSFTGGKMSNPFRWKNGKDYMFWDGDITPEGAAGRLQYQPSELWTLYANTGYFIMDENSSSRDPHVLGLQGGVAFAASEDVELGGRLSWYEWSSLNRSFFERGASFGNTGAEDFSTGAGVFRSGLSDDSISAGEISAYVRYEGIENWPVLVYGHYATNFDAESLSVDVDPDPNVTQIVSAGEEDEAWGVGAEIGDKKKFVKAGLGYFHLEANYFPAMMIDSDVTDGFTNRKAWAFYLSRQILANTDVNLTLFKSDRLERGPLFTTSVAGSDRYRLQTDLQVKF